MRKSTTKIYALPDGAGRLYALMLKWAKDIKIMVVSCDYRPSPENRYATALEDCAGCFQWVAANAARLGIDPLRIVVPGVIAGSTLAASFCLINRDRGFRAPCLQMLIYPALDDRMTALSMNTHTDQPGWTQVDTKHMWAHYLGPNRGDVLPMPHLRTRAICPGFRPPIS